MNTPTALRAVFFIDTSLKFRNTMVYKGGCMEQAILLVVYLTVCFVAAYFVIVGIKRCCGSYPGFGTMTVCIVGIALMMTFRILFPPVFGTMVLIALFSFFQGLSVNSRR